MTARTKTRLEDAARGSGRSQSQEAEARIEGSFFTEDVLTFLFGSNIRLEEVLILRRYLEAIKEATVRAGDRADRWWVYAAAAPFALDRDRIASSWRDGNLDRGAFDVAAMAEPIRAETEKILQRTIASLADRGAPGLPTAYSTIEEADAAGRHLYDFRKSCEILGNRRRFEGNAELREKYAPIYLAAAEWSQHEKQGDLSPSEKQIYAAILELAAAD
ncbi:TraY domain-containing protein [Magnetospirillum sp. UT-4]|uniref:TraY domain-containing protein n=1 Tax=Magnetospirillum sp. UT-4 TaxID=2681467 RepID=UPI001573F2B7|nr:TraY domain-containing protein [Magnetospirillum sp. UT-4]